MVPFFIPFNVIMSRILCIIIHKTTRFCTFLFLFLNYFAQNVNNFKILFVPLQAEFRTRAHIYILYNIIMYNRGNVVWSERAQ